MQTPQPLGQAAAAAPGDFADAVSSHRPYLVRFARQRLRDTALVDDVVQETLLAALQAAQGFQHKASLRTWLTGILLRRIADSLREQYRRATAQGDAAVAGDDNGRPTADAIDWFDPQRRLESRQFLDALAEALKALSPIAARVFALREIDGLSNQEAAQQLALTPGHCAVLLHRARASLRDGLVRRWLAPARRAPAFA
jgi:RNA polymerase sigma-70 factor, ECF subfamily